MVSERDGEPMLGGINNEWDGERCGGGWYLLVSDVVVVGKLLVR